MSITHFVSAEPFIELFFADGTDGQTAADGAALRKMVDEINANFNEKEVEQQLSIVYLEWTDQNIESANEFLVLCNTFASTGFVTFDIFLFFTTDKLSIR